MQRAIDPNRQRDTPYFTLGELRAQLMPGPVHKYTDEDVVLLKQTLREVLSEVARDAELSPSKVILPRLVEERVSLTHSDQIVAEAILTRTLRLRGVAEIPSYEPSAVANVKAELTYSRALDRIEIQVPDGHAMILISNEGHDVLGPGPHARSYSIAEGRSQRFILELYNNEGRKIDDRSFEVPYFQEEVALHPHAGKIIETDEGRRLYAGLESYEVRKGRGLAWMTNGSFDVHEATWTYAELTPIQDEQLATQAREAFRWPEGELSEGVYFFFPSKEGRGEELAVLFEKFRGGTFRAAVGSETVWLQPSTGAADLQHARVFTGRGDCGTVTFDPESNQFEIETTLARSQTVTTWRHQVVPDDAPYVPDSSDDSARSDSLHSLSADVRSKSTSTFEGVEIES